MIALQDIHTSHAHYLFVEKLLQSAFPEEERRDDEQQRAYTDYNPKFHCLLIRDFDKPIGLLTYWDFTDFASAMAAHITSRITAIDFEASSFAGIT